MPNCASCGAPISGAPRFCPGCGTPAAFSDALATRTVAVSMPHSATARPSRGARFAPGALLAGRYRIIALLGKGGMGEVYRADDLSLDQPVALKFLPAALAASPDAIDRFRGEVRIARQVSHPNVCRVYDLGEIEGCYFLSMEYVDGEDLGSLLRRIGRLPADKALEIARKLCAGLAAAHAKGVLHRDLKPANVMLDSRGHVLLTDFGLAGLAGQIEGAEVRNGTPAYMAPEQLAGEEVTVRSDIYSLGLVLYEIFTGKLPYESDTLAGLIRARSQSSPANPSAHVKDLDPIVERMILRCLEAKPANRPPSALAVAAGLTGGNALDAALAAGETPSPEMVAAAGEGEGLSLRAAAALSLVILAASFGCWALAVRESALDQLRPEYSPEVLAQKARDAVRLAGGNPRPADSAYGFSWENSFVGYAEKNDKPHPDWNAILAHRPSLLRFWYRQADSPLTSESFHDDLLTPGLVDLTDPHSDETGMTQVALDFQGRLLDYRRMPAELLGAPPKSPPPPVDWNPLFAAAGLDISQFKPAEPQWTFLAASDTRAAWEGAWPGAGSTPSRPLRVEAASLRGQPVAFSLVGPWTKPGRQPGNPPSGAGLAIFLMRAVLVVVLCAGSALLARRNLRRGRGDRRGALWLASFTFWAHMALWLCSGHFALSPGTFAMFLLALCTSTFAAVLVWAVYLALESYVRRSWPQTLIGWSAVLTGRVRDPIVGRDLLIGLAWGIVLPLLSQFSDTLHGGPHRAPGRAAVEALLGARGALAICLSIVPGAVRYSLLFLLLLFLLRVTLRNQWLAGAAFAVIFALLNGLLGGDSLFDGISALVVYGLIALILVRWGLLAAVALYFADSLMWRIPATANLSAWYFANAAFMLSAVLALTAWAFHTATAGKRLGQPGLLD